MDYYSHEISRLIEEFSRLPGIGSKSAQRLAFHVINMPEEQAESLARSILDARRNVRYCKECCTLTDAEVCPICRAPPAQSFQSTRSRKRRFPETMSKERRVLIATQSSLHFMKACSTSRFWQERG